MIYFTALLINLSILTPILRINKVFHDKHKALNKYFITFFSILFSINTFISMYLGKLFYIFMNHITIYYLGFFCLFILSIYYISQYRRKKEYDLGLDTSFYLEEKQIHKILLNNPELIYLDTSSLLDIYGCVKFSYYFFINNFIILFSAALINIDMSITIIFTFIISMLFFYIYDFIVNFSMLDFIIRYEDLIISFTLLAVTVLCLLF